jgi:hypothetical protein
LWASWRVRVEVRGNINATLLQKPMDVSQFAQFIAVCRRVKVDT